MIDQGHFLTCEPSYPKNKCHQLWPHWTQLTSEECWNHIDRQKVDGLLERMKWEWGALRSLSSGIFTVQSSKCLRNIPFISMQRLIWLFKLKVRPLIKYVQPIERISSHKDYSLSSNPTFNRLMIRCMSMILGFVYYIRIKFLNKFSIVVIG